MPEIKLAKVVRVSQAVRLVGIGRSMLYQLMNSGEIETIKVGRMMLIPIDSLREFIRKRRRYSDFEAGGIICLEITKKAGPVR